MADIEILESQLAHLDANTPNTLQTLGIIYPEETFRLTPVSTQVEWDNLSWDYDVPKPTWEELVSTWQSSLYPDILRSLMAKLVGEKLNVMEVNLSFGKFIMDQTRVLYLLLEHRALEIQNDPNATAIFYDWQYTPTPITLAQAEELIAATTAAGNAIMANPLI